jgi:L-rhamnose isomerase/sugar isomerase
MDERDVLRRLRGLEIETPSWGYGNSGTRFHVYPWPGAARTVYERIADAAVVHRFTRCCPSVALHIPWDAVDDYGELRRFAEAEGVRLGAINPNLFGSDE